MLNFIKIFLLFFCAYIQLFTLPSISFSSEIDDNISKIQKSYENIKDLKGNFVQKNIIKSLNRTDTYKGEFFIKLPMKMKWIYRGKASQDITINRDSVLIFKRGDAQAYKAKFDKATYGQTPVALLSGFGNIREEFHISWKEKSIFLRPKVSAGNIASIKIIMSDSDGGFPIRSFIIQDEHNNVVEIDIRDVVTNTEIKDSFFEFSLPKGVNIYEQNP
jgi:chaperone LolA